MNHFSIYFVVKLYCCLKRPKINEKEAGDGPFYKYSCRKLLQKQLFYGIDPTPV